MRFPSHSAAKHWLDEIGGDIDYDSSEDSEIVIAFVFDSKGERTARQFHFEKGLKGAV